MPSGPIDETETGVGGSHQGGSTVPHPKKQSSPVSYCTILLAPRAPRQ